MNHVVISALSASLTNRIYVIRPSVLLYLCNRLQAHMNIWKSKGDGQV